MIIPPQSAEAKLPRESVGVFLPARLNSLAQIAGIGGAVYFFLHCAMIITGPEKRLMAWLYDDSFYYLILAKHFSEERIPSFDGVTLTTGYHPLWMWWCSIIYSIRGRLDLTYVRLCMATTAGICLALLAGALRDSLRDAKNGVLWALGLAATSYSGLNNGLTVMEWPLVVLFWAALHRIAMRCFIPGRSGPNVVWRFRWITMFLVGAGGALSRTDFGLIPACYLAGGLLVAWRFKYWIPARLAGTAFAGSACGLGFVFLYNHAFTGSWLQQSAEVKYQFASLTSPFNPIPALWQFARVLLYLPPLDMTPEHKSAALRVGVGFLALVGVPVILFLITRRGRPLRQFGRILLGNAAEMFAISSAAFGVLGYLLVYSFNSQATYGWYTATVTGFIVILAARLFASWDIRTCAKLLFPIMLLNMGASYYFGGNARAQFQENANGKLLRRDHPGARMGGGDVGKPSFYNEGRMFNLDGLMNNDVVPYLLSGRFHCYVLEEHIEYLTNTGTISQPLTDAERAKRHEARLPWALYFTPIEGWDTDGDPGTYLKTNFDAIRNSGECAQDSSQRTH